MNVNKYETANSWFSAMREEGYNVPVTLLQTIERLMKIEKLSFAEAYNKLSSRISIKDKEISFR